MSIFFGRTGQGEMSRDETKSISGGWPWQSGKPSACGGSKGNAIGRGKDRPERTIGHPRLLGPTRKTAGNVWGTQFALLYKTVGSPGLLEEKVHHDRGPRS